MQGEILSEKKTPQQDSLAVNIVDRRGRSCSTMANCAESSNWDGGIPDFCILSLHKQLKHKHRIAKLGVHCSDVSDRHVLFEPFRRRKFSFRLGREDLNSSGLFFYRHLLAFVTSQVKSRLSRTEPEARCRRTRGSNLFLGWRHWVTENISLSPAHIIQSGTPCGCAQFKGKKKNAGGKYNADESIPSQWFREEDGNPRQ